MQGMSTQGTMGTTGAMSKTLVRGAVATQPAFFDAQPGMARISPDQPALTFSRYAG